ncbi:hypothetical protein [Rufibacter tibetensis]|uniref:Uncharacterized protein n=1 Tax=Rufibacter tibetensis TaxID=512763 RepID=A0A0P0D1M6_9BACT|nr:hypothetical protein [Rufibacter tibetensis]ALJ00766.1 hypothetical protein DC20_19475 [Rufibacter tibetensis]
MGNIIQASCTCGLESEQIFQGIGFQYYETRIRLEPAYCDLCGIVSGKDMGKNFCKCPKCRKKMKFYYEGLEADDNEDSDFPSSEYLESKEHWHCPKCKDENLIFGSMGCWD